MTTTTKTSTSARTTTAKPSASPAPDNATAGPSLADAQALASDAPGNAFSAWLYDPMLGRAEKAGMADHRRTLLAQARGSVLELSAGTGLNLEHYPHELGRLVLSEPNAHMAARLRKRADEFGRPVEVAEIPGELLPYADASFDTVVSTMVLCTVSDPRQTLDEVRRVLRPGGQLLFLEHVRADHREALAGWQDRLAGAWAWYADGCRCNQDTLALLAGAEFTVQVNQYAQWDKMPRLVRPLVSGTASPA